LKHVMIYPINIYLANTTPGNSFLFTGN
jgi:hypothetical protein